MPSSVTLTMAAVYRLIAYFRAIFSVTPPFSLAKNINLFIHSCADTSKTGGALQTRPSPALPSPSPLRQPAPREKRRAGPECYRFFLFIPGAKDSHLRFWEGESGACGGFQTGGERKDLGAQVRGILVAMNQIDQSAADHHSLCKGADSADMLG